MPNQPKEIMSWESLMWSDFDLGGPPLLQSRVRVARIKYFQMCNFKK